VETCGTCGEHNPERARFCLGCGRPLLADRDEVRKLVTILFADVVGSTALGERHDPEHYRRVLTGYFDRIRDIVGSHGGIVEKYIGDAVMAVFGLPTAHEDDALRAVRAAVDIDRCVTGLAEAADRGEVVLRWRIGVNTGEVSAGGPGEHTFATGDAINLAARLEQAAEPGEILLGDATHHLVRDAVTAERAPDLQVRGKAEPVAAYRLLHVTDHGPGRRRRFDQPFVGRHEELALLDWALRRALDGPTVQLVTVYGAAGIGKSRLVATALAAHDIRALQGRCLPYGDGVTFWPLAEALLAAAELPSTADPARTVAALRELAGSSLTDEEAAVVAATLGLTDGPIAEDVTATLRRYLLAVAGDEGLVLVIDDLHDAQPLLLDLLAGLTKARPAPLAVVAVSRPELLDHRPGWAGGAPNALSLGLERLEDHEVAHLLTARLPGSLDEVMVDRLAAAAGGNPLFLEELVSSLIERGELHRDEHGRWTLGDLDAPLRLPTTVHSLLAARIDALPPADRRLLGRASVCGTSFTTAAVAALLEEDARSELSDRLEGLVDRDLLQPQGSGYAFRHHFARDAVYAGLSRRRRAELHERHATWLDAQASSPQRDEFVTYHLERALTERTELDPRDPSLEALGRLAAERLGAAGDRAFARGDMPAAVRLLGRALDLIDEPRRRVELRTTRARALVEVGEVTRAVDELTAATDEAGHLGDTPLVMHTRITALWVRSNLDLDGWVAAARAAATEAIEVFAATEDHGGLSRAWGLRAEVHYLLARFEAAAEAMSRAERHARAAGDEVEEREDAVGTTTVLVPGPRPLVDVIAVCDDLERRYGGDGAVAARLHQARATIAAMRGDERRARAALAAAREGFERLGQAFWLATAAVTEGHLETLVGDRGAAHAALRRGLDELVRIGDRAQAATVAAVLACELETDDRAELEQLVAFASDNAHPDDLEAQVRVCLARAHLLGVAGDLEAALATAREAVAAAEPSDALVLQADAHLALARSALAVGSGRDVIDAAARAHELYRRKGHTVGVALAAALVGDGVPPGAPTG
jgi:class 3 adenylate cyclase/tetratricopeptide (TPR) repeat protein